MITFKEGVFDNRLVGPSDKPSGTFVQWLPSEEFFTHTFVEINKVKELFKTLVCLCPGLTIKLHDNEEDIISFYSENGLNDLVDEAVKDKEIISKRFVLNHASDKYKMDMVLTYGNNYSSTIVPYVNTGLTESGPHITQIKTIITREFNKFFKEKKWLKEKDSNLSGEDLQEGMYIVFNLTAPNVGYDAQVKSRITKIEMAPFSSALSLNFSTWLKNNEKEIKIIFEKATAARKARDAAKKARDRAREGNKKTKKALLDLPTKLVDANSKKRTDCELLIVEGDSAAGGLVEARDPEIQAVFPIRGKIIAAYKNAPDKIFANQEVNNIIKAIGLDINAKTGKLIYDSQKLRYGKILLCADGDADGQAIKNLLIELFWWLCPELVLNGHIYSTLPPLFRITTKKNEYVFLSDKNALDKYKEVHRNEVFLVNRNKG